MAMHAPVLIEARQFGVTLTAKLRHAALWVAVKKLGSQQALADHLQVGPSVIGAWVNLRRCPPASWSAGRLREIEKKLFDLTGQTFDELFPEALRESKSFLAASKTVEVTREVPLKALASDRAEVSRLAGPEENAISIELHEKIETVLNQLDGRERAIIKARYGFEGPPEDLRKIGSGMDLCCERIRQIEARAMRKLQSPKLASQVSGFLD